MPGFLTERYCREFDEQVVVTVYYKEVITLGGCFRVPTGIKCSASPNGQCGRCNACVALKEAQDGVRNRRF